jgi:FkbM family methyltransferase
MANIAWELSVFLSRWRMRVYYAAVAPFLYRNWWDVFFVKLRSGPTVLELRNRTKYEVRPNTTDLAVINEAVCLDPYLKRGHLHLSPDSTVVDVGANIGDFTIQAAKLCPAGHVYAVEPISGNCECIRRQLQLNQVTNVTILHLALGDCDGEVAIHNAGSHSSVYWGEDASERVRQVNLESFMHDHNIETIDLLKLDCEGAEWNILPGAVAQFPKIRQICMEYHNGKLNAEWLEPWLVEQGYTVRRTVGEWNGLLWAWK